MKEIDFNYLNGWKTYKYKELFEKNISIKGFLTRECLTKEQIEDYNLHGTSRKYDTIYSGLVERKCTGKYRIILRSKSIGVTVNKNIYEFLVNKLNPFYFKSIPSEKIIYIGDSLKFLLEENGYKDYEGRIRIYGVFGSIVTKKTNVGKIWKAEILDKNDNILDIIENQN